MAYATYTDLEAIWRPLSADEQEQATALLDYAAVIIDAYATIDATDEEQMKRAKYVSCSMVRRAMQASESDMIGITQASATMGPFNQQATFQNPTGDLYLSGTEKGILGASGSFIASVRPVIRPVIVEGAHDAFPVV